MAVSKVIQICPTIESLCDPIKGRPKSSLKNDIVKRYHCPIETCKYYHENHYFEKMKFLRQHFVKVHKTRTFSCDKCGVQFPLESTLSHHKLTCGVSYLCYCNAEYKSYEALLTHFKRKHNQKACVRYKDMMGLLKAHSTAQNLQKSVDNVIDVRAIIMKNMNRQKLLLKEKKNKTGLSKETQTGMKMCKILPNLSKHSEISEDQQLKKTVSMQTTPEFLPKKRKRSKLQNSTNKINCCKTSNISFSTSSTQTTPMKENQSFIFSTDKSKFEKLPKTAADHSIFELYNEPCGDLAIKNLNDVSTFEITPSSSIFEDNSNCPDISNQLTTKRMISADDPNLGFAPYCYPDESRPNIISDETQTNLEFTMNDLVKTDFNLIVCSDSETQTPFEDFFDSSYMDTYTQTCDSLFSDLDFVDIETQTF